MCFGSGNLRHLILQKSPRGVTMSSISSGPNLTRRTLLGAFAAAGAVPVLNACGGVSTSGADGGDGAVNFLSTQFTPVEERLRFETILKNRVKGTEVAF